MTRLVIAIEPEGAGSVKLLSPGHGCLLTLRLRAVLNFGLNGVLTEA